MKKRTGMAVALLAAALLVVGFGADVSALEDIQFTETKTFEVGSEPEIDLETVAGDIEYTATSGNDASVEIVIDVRADDDAEAQRMRDEIEIIVDGRDGMLEAKVERPRDFSKLLRREYGKNHSISVSFYITGPEGASGFVSSVSGNALVDGITGPVDISTVSGDLNARKITKRLSANTVSGDLEVSDCGERVNTKTVSGSLRVQNCGDDLRAGSVSGRIDIAGVRGDVEASSVSGDVQIQDADGEVAVNTTSGDIDIEHKSGNTYIETVSGDVAARSMSSAGEVVVESTSGSIELHADADNIGRIALATFSGDIRLHDSFGGTRKAKRGFLGRGNLNLKLGNGDLDVRVSTHSGDIRILEL